MYGHSLFNPHINPGSRYCHYPHLTDEQTETWRKKLVPDQRPGSVRTGIQSQGALLQSQCFAMACSSVFLDEFQVH